MIQRRCLTCRDPIEWILGEYGYEWLHPDWPDPKDHEAQPMCDRCHRASSSETIRAANDKTIRPSIYCQRCYDYIMWATS